MKFKFDKDFLIGEICKTDKVIAEIARQAGIASSTLHRILGGQSCTLRTYSKLRRLLQSNQSRRIEEK